MFRIIHGLCNFPSIFQETTSYCERRARSHLLHQPFVRTNAFFYSFVPSGATACNHLTEQQVSLQASKGYCTKLHRITSNLMDTRNLANAHLAYN